MPRSEWNLTDLFLHLEKCKRVKKYIYIILEVVIKSLCLSKPSLWYCCMQLYVTMEFGSQGMLADEIMKKINEKPNVAWASSQAYWAV